MRALRAALLCLCLAAGSSDAYAAEAARAAMGALDIIFIGLAVYVVWRIISNISRQRRERDDNTYDVTPESPDDDGGRDARSRRAQAAWEYLTGEKGPELHAGGEHEKDIPGTFNEREFLKGAKLIYGRIKKSWAARDLADLRQFAAQDMMSLFERWAGERPEREEMTVLLVEAKVLDLRRDGKRTEVQVAYDATLNDDPKVKELKKVHEVWTFSRDETVADANWLLESMERTQ
ncbi:MAG: Tim44 domain-containing protein [Thermodesulfobacteriota bacterium]